MPIIFAAFWFADENAVTSSIDSRVILDVNGAETLLGRGDMRNFAADALNLLPLQGCFVADDELKRLVEYWRSQSPVLPLMQLTFSSSFDINPSSEIDNNEEDSLLPQATYLAKKHQTVSTSFWKRFADRLRSCGAVGGCP